MLLFLSGKHRSIRSQQGDEQGRKNNEMPLHMGIRRSMNTERSSVTRKRSSVARGFLDDQPTVASFDEVKRFPAGNSQCIGAIVLLKFGDRFVGTDRDSQVFQLDADAGFANDPAAAFVLPSAARLFAGRIKFFAVGAEVGGHVFGRPGFGPCFNRCFNFFG